MTTSSDVPQYISAQVQFYLSSSKISNYSFTWALWFVIRGIQVSVGSFLTDQGDLLWEVQNQSQQGVLGH
jgi:hypothetical protein